MQTLTTNNRRDRNLVRTLQIFTYLSCNMQPPLCVLLVCDLIPAQCQDSDRKCFSIYYFCECFEGWDSGVIKEVSPSPDLICNFANKGKLMRLLVSVKSECFAAVRDTRDTCHTPPRVSRDTLTTAHTHHTSQITDYNILSQQWLINPRK